MIVLYYNEKSTKRNITTKQNPNGLINVKNNNNVK